MSDGQVIALWLMLFIGAGGGLPVLCSKEWSIGRDMVPYSGYLYGKKWRIAAAVWVAAWWLPPLALLWVKGVFG